MGQEVMTILTTETGLSPVCFPFRLRMRSEIPHGSKGSHVTTFCLVSVILIQLLVCR